VEKKGLPFGTCGGSWKDEKSKARKDGEGTMA